MGKHSRKSSFRTSTGKLGWATVAGGAAVVAVLSTTAWAAIGGDVPGRTVALSLPATTPTATKTIARPAASPKKATRPHSRSASTPKASHAIHHSPAVTASRTHTSPQPAKTLASAHLPKVKATSGSATTETIEAQSIKADTSEDARKAQSRAKEYRKAKRQRQRSRVIASGSCGASYYGEGQMTASGERFNPGAMTAAHRTLPMGSRVRVTNPATGASVTVRINDRGPFVGGRCFDLSEAAFAAIGNLSAGVMHVRYQVLAR
ncbi:rare lipoprotein A [Nonomuraea maritima]|uniref:Probable endolytic peptidoglycan transglycosylase RlpA n=1 Tax=Nonomuraea maritima TaxID=683260 RepID=A0A1G9RF59_9ACTN|nr:septal ring lytic transglycosylase RlpA family protein [Nonomuraea maritima]SDM21959.1 rare lipoprotein A [Nonomuraea maritima]